MNINLQREILFKQNVSDLEKALSMQLPIRNSTKYINMLLIFTLLTH